ncbi:MAG TPA: enolase C-terminal domain-like protein [Patescibacteria group bacterium]|nr:enolase C-terminal domain-like protein [Patescibacteria group bacterium]
MKIKEVSAKAILDSRKEKTILISIKTNVGDFSASSPSGKSTGKFEAKPYKKSLEEDVEKIKEFSEYFLDENLERFDDLKRVEDIVDGHVGANTLFALESAILKAIAKEQKIEIWELVQKSSNTGKHFPRLVGNCIGGGLHSHGKRKPDFQEFLLIPEGSVKEQWEKNKKIKRDAEFSLKKEDENFKGDKNDEDAWETSLNEKQVFDILQESETDMGTDVASSTFYSRKKYHYANPLLTRTREEQIDYLSNLIKNFNLFYIEDPFEQEDFESFAKLLKKFPNSLIVGDDLTTTNYKRLEKAIKMKSINAIIIKPNQIGFLTEVKSVCELAKKNNIKLVFSHRSGETEESILADLAFGFGADFFKCGITGKEREVKIKRLMEIEKSIK